MLTARPLSVWDAAFCWRLAGYYDVREASHDPSPPTWWGHALWMLRWLFERDRQAWVIRYSGWVMFTEVNGTVVDDERAGLVRVHLDGEASVVSVAASHHRRGIRLFGLGIVSGFVEANNWPTPVAHIRADNHPSIGLFAKAGYEMVGARDGWVTMRRAA